MSGNVEVLHDVEPTVDLAPGRQVAPGEIKVHGPDHVHAVGALEQPELRPDPWDHYNLGDTIEGDFVGIFIVWTVT